MQARGDDAGTRRDQSTLPPQAEKKHPDEYERDLNPDRLAGQNIGLPADGLPNAYDVKPVHRTLRGFTDDDLKQIPVVPEGERLEQGGTYLDLAHRDRGEFTAMGGQVAHKGEFIVPKDEVPYPLWNRLRGIQDPERT